MSFTTYKEALAWLYSFSDTERTGQFVRDREDNLARERALLDALGNPHRSYGIVHVAGTKGKGSTSALIAGILLAAGHRTGLYTQPDLHTFRERMRVQGTLIPESEVVRLATRVRAALTAVDPAMGPFITYEVATALALLYFREAGVRMAVVEVGLGGRLDATNVVEPLVSVITSISYDHMNVLGNTLAEIAREKAGILKRGVPAVTSATAPEAVATLVRIAAERDVPLTRIGPESMVGCDVTYRAGAAESERQFFDVTTPHATYIGLELSLLGEHQIENAAAALAVAERLNRDGAVPIPEDALRAGLRAARWPARLQVVRRNPLVVVDGAHNADSFAKLFTALRRHFTFDRLVLVLGLMADKDIPGMVREVAASGAASIILTSFANARAAAPAEVAAQLRDAAPTLEVRVREPSADALAGALAEAEPHDLICVTGGVAFAGEALRWLAAQPGTIPGAIEIDGVDH